MPKKTQKKYRTILSKPAGKAKAIQLIAAGYKHQEVADKMGVHETTLSNFKRKYRDEIQKAQEELINALPDAVGTATELIRKYHDPKKSKSLSHQEKSHAHAHIMELMKACNLYPNNNIPLFIQQLIHSPRIDADANKLQKSDMLVVLQKLLK